MNKKKPPIPIRYGGMTTHFIQWSGFSFTMYAMQITNWTNFPVQVKMAKDGFYELSGDHHAVLSVLFDQRRITKAEAWKFLTGFIWPITIQSLSGARMGFLCICLNAGFWLKWAKATSKPSSMPSENSITPKPNHDTAHSVDHLQSHNGEKNMKLSSKLKQIIIGIFGWIFVLMFLFFITVFMLSGCTVAPPQAYQGGYYYQPSPSDQLFRVGTALMQSDRGYR